MLSLDCLCEKIGVGGLGFEGAGDGLGLTLQGSTLTPVLRSAAKHFLSTHTYLLDIETCCCAALSGIEPLVVVLGSGGGRSCI